MTYLNGEPLMMTDDGNLPDIIPRLRRIERGVLFKLPPYSVGFWVVPEAKVKAHMKHQLDINFRKEDSTFSPLFQVKICQGQPVPSSGPNFENVPTMNIIRNEQRSIPNARALNQLIVDKLKNPVSESDEEFYDDRILSDDSSERDLIRESLESPGPRSSRRVREITVEDIGQELKDKIREIREMLENKGSEMARNADPSEVLRAAEEKITSLTDQLGAATRLTNQHEEFDRFLHKSGLNQDFGTLMMNERKGLNGLRRSIQEKSPWIPVTRATPIAFHPIDPKIRRFRRSLSYPEDDYEEESTESYSSEEEDDTETRPNRKINYRKRLSRLDEDSDESGDHSSYSGSPALKSLEEKYKSFLSYRIQDGKKKLSELRRQKNKEETQEPKNEGTKKSNILGNDLQEEILMKEVEVLEKTEEAMANLIKNHKKRAQTIEEIILHEISDIKEDRLTALEDMRNHKEVTQGTSVEIHDAQEQISPKTRRNVLNVLNKSTDSKTKRSIEMDSNLNGLPENLQEEKKSKIEKRSADSSFEKSYRRRKSRRVNRDEIDSNEIGSRRLRKSRSERLERMKNFIQSRERIRDRNILRRKLNRQQYKHREDISDEESNESSGYTADLFDKPEEMVIKEIQKEILKKPERRTEVKQDEPEKLNAEVVKAVKKEDKRIENDNNRVNLNSNNDNNNEKRENENKRVSNQNNADDKKQKTEEKKQGSNQEVKINVKKVKTDEEPEYIPLKIDKNRGLNVLKRISNLVESINTREKGKKPSADVEDLSEEFYGDAFSKLTKRRHRRSHYREGKAESSEISEEPASKDAKILRKEMKLRKILERMNKRRKSSGENDNDHAKVSRLRSRLEAKLATLAATEPTTEPTVALQEVTETEKIEELTTVTPGKLVEHEESADKEEKVEQPQMIVEKNTEDDGTKVEEKNEDVAAIQDNVTETEMKVELKNSVAKEEKPENADSNDAKETTEVATEATTFETTLAATTIKVPEKKMDDLIRESMEAPQTILLIPEVDGLVYNPVIVANAAEGSEGQREAEYSSEEDSDVPNLEPYVREDLPQEETRSGRPDLPDLISELIEGERVPWKERTNQEEETSSDESYRDAQSNGGSEEGKILLPQYVEDPREVTESDGSYSEDEGKSDNNFASVSEVHVSRIPEGAGGEMKSSEKDSNSENVSSAGESSVSEVDDNLERTEAKDLETMKMEAPLTLRRRRRGILDRGILTPEERIRNFKRIVHRRHSPFSHRNELPVADEGGDSFWKMAGSTVKAVFNDVIPEAYGKTKNKIENLGIAEYFKEFGKIVEQMKNLDKLFANIGQAAVRNYIKGTEDEKGDYIQVIEKRRRNRRDTEEVLAEGKEPSSETTTAVPEPTTTPIPQDVQTTIGQPEDKPKAKGLKKSPKDRPNDLIRDIFLLDSNPGIVEVTKSPPTTEAPQTISLQPFESRYAKMPRFNHIRSKYLKRESLKNQPLSEAEVQSMGISKFAPWMKTTKDFISQALTTLQRQRELSEMIARESVNDLVKREIERKVIGKRDVSEDGHGFQVYQMPNRKRETYANADDANSRFLTQLQPGVYIVPTEEMKNLRSEQIIREAPGTKSGMPNMVTLNIYYDKKSQEWGPSREADPANVHDYMNYYNAPAAWSPVPIAGQTRDTVPPLHETAIDGNYVPSAPPFHTETKYHQPIRPRVIHYPEPYPEWIPASGYQPRTHQAYYYPEHHYAPTKSDWADFKSHHAPGNRETEAQSESGWAVQYEPTKKPPRAHIRPAVRPTRPFPDKKRSIGKGKTDSNFSGLALPFWKFFGQKKDEKRPVELEKREDDSSSESESIEELFAENRKRARMNEAKKTENEPEVAEVPEEQSEQEAKSRRRREATRVEFHDHDLIPEWFGTIQELDNTLHEHHDELERLARIVPLSLYDYDDAAAGEDMLHRKRRNADEEKPVLKSLKSEDSSLEVPDQKPEDKPANKDEKEADDPLSRFFKYAYESLIEMMKGMTGFV